jgi:hypothetical protein
MKKGRSLRTCGCRIAVSEYFLLLVASPTKRPTLTLGGVFNNFFVFIRMACGEVGFLRQTCTISALLRVSLVVGDGEVGGRKENGIFVALLLSKRNRVRIQWHGKELLLWIC